MTIRTQYHGTITCTKETANDLALVFCNAMDYAITSKDFKEAKRLATDIMVMYEAIDGYCDIDYKGIVEKVQKEEEASNKKEDTVLSKSNTTISMKEFKEINKQVEITNMRVNENGEVVVLGYYVGSAVLYYINICDFCSEESYEKLLLYWVDGSTLTQGQLNTLNCLVDVNIECLGESSETGNYWYSVSTNVGCYEVYSLG